MRVLVSTYGCQMNEHDSQKILSLLEAEGHERTQDPREADCIILNTCSVREKPEQKVYSALGRLLPLKRRKPSLIIGVGGCVAQQVGERLLQKAPHLDFVFGTHQIQLVPELVRVAGEGIRTCRVDMGDEVGSLHYCPDPGPGQVRAFVTIMQGCDNHCSYCIVPHVRGPEKSRPLEEILQEVRRLAGLGVKEVILLGQNVNSYGRNLEGGFGFVQLLERLEDVQGIERIRFTTSHPKDLSVELMDAMARLGKVCEHLHLPVQSGSTRVLQAMNRGYTREEYLGKVEALRKRVPGISLTTDLIVGFPGETEQDLELTLDLLKRVRFDSIYSFKFSPRPFTAAASMEDNVPGDIKAERLRRVQELQEAITADILQECVGSLEEVLVEGPSLRGSHQVTGRTRTYRIVHMPGDPDRLRGRLVTARIHKSLKHSLWASPLEGEETPR
jgi:tRNA-2-methylthio-N6-dimethylallyladenosine synthase